MQHQATLDTPTPAEFPAPPRPLKVLVADPTAHSRLVLAQAVAALGHCSVCCDSGSATLAAVATSAPDIVLLDLQMPDIGGDDLLQRLRQAVTDKWLPLVVTAAQDGDGQFVAALSRGADDYLPRPVNPDLLRARLAFYQRVLPGLGIEKKAGRGDERQAERKAERKAEREAEQKAEQKAERMKEEFLATVSHELRTPLTSIIGAIGILNAGAAGAMPAQAIALLQMAQRNAERLSRLIDDVMDLTKLEGDRMHLVLRPLALAPLLRESLAAMAGYALQRKVQLALQLQAGEAMAQADGARLSQVMANLVSNAVKHAPKGSTVEVLLRGEGAGWRIEVRDQGLGVPGPFRAHLFEKFSQADASDGRQNQGTGLGLYISRKLVRRMGGEVGLDPAAPKGATFYVFLPAANGVALPTLVVSRDVSQRERLEDWVSACGPVAGVADLAGAQGWVQHHGAVAAVVADLAAQGGADQFLAALQRLCALESIVLAGDAADQAFADACGAVWVAPGPAARAELVAAVNQARRCSAHSARATHA